MPFCWPTHSVSNQTWTIAGTAALWPHTPGVRAIIHRPALLALLLTGCVRAEYPPPLWPLPADAETYARVRHIAVYEPPRLQTDATPIWPGPPAVVQTSLDILHRSPHVDARPTAATLRHRGLGLCRATAAQPTAAGMKLGLCFSKEGGGVVHSTHSPHAPAFLHKGNDRSEQYGGEA